MICVSIAGLSFEQCQKALKNIEMAEIRLDRVDFSLEQVQEIFSMHHCLIATCRSGNTSQEERRELLLTAVEAGAAYVDIEIENRIEFINAVAAACQKTKCKVIISYHNYINTPPAEELKALVNQSFTAGADVAKIACQVNSETEAARILGIYDFDYLDYQANTKKKIVAIGMGDKGKITRPASLLLGAPFTYAAFSISNQTAPGQMTKKTLDDILNCISRKE